MCVASLVILYLGELLLVRVLDRVGLPDLLFKTALLSLYVLKEGSEPEECFNLRNYFNYLTKDPAHLSLICPSFFFSSVQDILVGHSSLVVEFIIIFALFTL